MNLIVLLQLRGPLGLQETLPDIQEPKLVLKPCGHDDGCVTIT